MTAVHPSAPLHSTEPPPLPLPPPLQSSRVRRSSSTLARLTRSVSKLGSSKASRARQAAAAAAASGSGSSALPFRRISSAATLGAAAGVGGGQAPSQEPAAAARQGGRGRDPLGGAATLAARIQLFEQGRFNLDSELGALTGGWAEWSAGCSELAAALPGWLCTLDHTAFPHLLLPLPPFLLSPLLPLNKQ